MTVPIVDLFAGPGGLSEGFEKYKKRGSRVFHSVLAIEKDNYAHQTLLLRSFLRQFRQPPRAYYARLRGQINSQKLFEQYPQQYEAAAVIAIKLALSRRNSRRVEELVKGALAPMQGKAWVLIGGPPCQAYSLVGRSRMKATKSETFKYDGRHFLFQEYLRILKTFQPPVFLMENVKGLLSSSAKGIEIFQRILKDFSAAGYTIHSFVKLGTGDELKPADYIIKTENFGIPQARHRVILLGVRKDLDRGTRVLQPEPQGVTIADAIRDLPRIRSHVSPPSADSATTWMRELRRLSSVIDQDGRFKGLRKSTASWNTLPSGAPYIPATYPNAYRSAWLRKNDRWFIDRRIEGITLHEGRHHMPTDLRRYLFASHYAQLYGVSSPHNANSSFST
jgi:DNA (cytosine-5)-methyltransferase 1